MIRLESWNPRQNLPDHPALIVGKGPTADNLGKLDLSKYHVFTLGHAIQAVPSAMGAHFIDIEPYLACAEDVEKKAQWLIMPLRPHEKHTRALTIEEYIQKFPSLKKMDEAGRLVVYKKHVCHVGQAPKYGVSCLFFSAEALFNVVGIAGFKTVHSVGVDGGNKYSSLFSTANLLNNGRNTFDDQMPELYAITAHYRFTWDRLFTSVAHAK